VKVLMYVSGIIGSVVLAADTGSGAG